MGKSSRDVHRAKGAMLEHPQEMQGSGCRQALGRGDAWVPMGVCCSPLPLKAQLQQCKGHREGWDAGEQMKHPPRRTSSSPLLGTLAAGPGDLKQSTCLRERKPMRFATEENGSPSKAGNLT